MSEFNKPKYNFPKINKLAAEYNKHKRLNLSKPKALKFYQEEEERFFCFNIRPL